MIRLFLKNYNDAELCQLYNALHLARLELSNEKNPCKDLDEVLVYLSGYMDARGISE